MHRFTVPKCGVVVRIFLQDPSRILQAPALCAVLLLWFLRICASGLACSLQRESSWSHDEHSQFMLQGLGVSGLGFRGFSGLGFRV